MITIFTDGASKGNPGTGGWAAIIADETNVKEIGGRKINTTNNAMELTAVVKALQTIDEGAAATVFTDSKYVKTGAEVWRLSWRENDWKLKSKKSVENKDLWLALDDLLSRKDISWVLVPGHSDLPGNERVDKIASDFAIGKKPTLFAGPRLEYTVDVSDTSFDTEKHAAKGDRRARQSKPAFSYVSLVDGVIGLHKSWGECEARVKGVSGARFKKALSKDEEATIVAGFLRND